jgi:hypothetical protein
MPSDERRRPCSTARAPGRRAAGRRAGTHHRPPAASRSTRCTARASTAWPTGLRVEAVAPDGLVEAFSVEGAAASTCACNGTPNGRPRTTRSRCACCRPLVPPCTNTATAPRAFATPLPPALSARRRSAHAPVPAEPTQPPEPTHDRHARPLHLQRARTVARQATASPRSSAWCPTSPAWPAARSCRARSSPKTAACACPRPWWRWA